MAAAFLFLKLSHLTIYILDNIDGKCYQIYMRQKLLVPKEETSRTRKLIAEIPEDLFKALKIRSVETDLMMKDLVAEALRRFLGVKEGGEKNKK